MSHKILISKTNSNLPALHNEAIKEISVGDFSRVMRSHFGVYSEVVPGKPYAVRYTGPPFDPLNEDCKSLQVFTHAKGTTFSPLNVIAVLDKFEIPQSAYIEAIEGQGKLIRMRPQSTREPNEG